MNLYESIKNNSTKLTESVNGFIHVVWGPDASEDNLDDNERLELVGLVNAIEEAEDDYNNGGLDLESFINLIKEECKEHGLTDDETKKAVDFYEKSYKDEEQEDEEQEDDEESFIMHNENSDKDVRVWKQNGKWYDEEGNRYMGYLSKQDVKNYFKGNWHEVKESDDLEKNKDFQSKAKALALDSEEGKTFVKKVKDNNGTFFDIFKTKEGKYVDANNRPLDDEDLKQFGLKEDELRHKKGYCYNCGAKLDPKDTYVINGNYYCGACKGDAEQRQLDDERAYKERQKDLTNNFNDTYEESDLKENVGDKNDYSDKIKALATKFCKQHYGRLSTYFKGIEIESKTTPTAIKYKLTLDVLTNLSRVYDDVQELADFISGHIPAVKFVKSDTYNMTGADLNEDLNLYFIQNTEFKDIGGDNVMEDSELKEFYDNPEPTDDTTSVEGTVTITYKFTKDIPKNWNYEQLLDDIGANLSDYQDEVVDFEVDCSYEGPQDYEDRRSDEQYDEERLNND